ncbi:DNA translocase FtsK [Pseudorhodoplanes sinuspersici]|uniref:DNA translocase FtsK n=1 Tax=Pseudorhodoplanes sinuspersici TaxID=1235591 RepID=A0A1W6ZP13_9HYPH|nr:DNA translocase FtsK [Pseudorhodoplanes sinuspersici]ARP99133.1 cell division protein FtsK [Pseudorhodoplanes sinuspersici]RKE69214.1 DNA translocase FtsK [Pseudorhodoplanes sinuspersici]
MPAFIDRSLESLDFLSDDFRGAIRRRIGELIGLALILLSLMLTLALATWSVQDPSFSHATDAPVRNLLGRPGASFADLSVQLFGLASIVLVLPVAIWGWRMLTHRPVTRKWTRSAFWFGGLLLAAAFAGCLPRSVGWPLPAGMGGVMGDAMLKLPTLILGTPLPGMSRLLLATISGFAALAMLAIAAGLGLQPPGDLAEDLHREAEELEEEDERTSISIGWLVHTLLSAKARLMLFLRKQLAGDDMDDLPVRAKGKSRAEPRMRPAEPEENDLDEDDESAYEDKEEEEEEEEPAPAPRKSRVQVQQPKTKKGGFVLPALNLLAAPKASDRATLSTEEIEERAEALESVLEDFGVKGEIINARPGPVVTLYELEPAPGIKSSRVIGLADDIARSMSAISARVAVVPGRNAIGIELPNEIREKVYFREMLAAGEYNNTQAKLPLCLGKTIGGEPVVVDLARMPHLLIAGTTGSGKSVAINTMLLSLLYKLRPDQCRLIMIDPKMLELSVYDGIPHLLTPVVTDPKKAVVALKWAVREMEERYKKMSKLGVRNIDGYNTRLVEAKAKGEALSRTVHTGYDKESGEAIYEKEELEFEELPYVVVIVDEMADLMMVAGKDIEGAIQRLAQMARAAGIHVVLATQRPSVDVITGTIKANFPTRISFQVTSKIDSRTILGEQGAEQLLGQGDMLYMAGGGRISRVHGPFVADDEVEKVVRHLKSQGVPQYLEEVTRDDSEDEDGAVFDATGMGAEKDLYQQAVDIVLRDRKASTSYIQRRLQIGYNRAATLMERMEQEGVVGQANHAGKREILIEEGASRFG